MPNLKSAKKRVRIEEKRRARNHSIKSAARTFVTRARNAIAVDPAAPETEETIRAALSELDSAVTTAVLHRNNAARRKSRLMARLHKAQAAGATATSTAAARPARVSTRGRAATGTRQSTTSAPTSSSAPGKTPATGTRTPRTRRTPSTGE
jgi:small subunit ribosomal protein S20